MNAKEYVEAIAQELGRVRGRGLLLSPEDARLALCWHSERVPIEAVLAEVRRASRLKPRMTPPRGAAEMLISLQALAPALERLRSQRRASSPPARGLRAELGAAARRPGLAGRSAWESLADSAEQLIAEEGADRYWTEAVRALKVALRELPRSAGLQAGAALRARISPRPRGMTRRAYQRSLQLMLLSASSERLGLPPKPFLL